jgi:hypothetical protein
MAKLEWKDQPLDITEPTTTLLATWFASPRTYSVYRTDEGRYFLTMGNLFGSQTVATDSVDDVFKLIGEAAKVGDSDRQLDLPTGVELLEAAQMCDNLTESERLDIFAQMDFRCKTIVWLVDGPQDLWCADIDLDNPSCAEEGHAGRTACPCCGEIRPPPWEAMRYPWLPCAICEETHLEQHDPAVPPEQHDWNSYGSCSLCDELANPPLQFTVQVYRSEIEVPVMARNAEEAAKLAMASHDRWDDFQEELTWELGTVTQTDIELGGCWDCGRTILERNKIVVGEEDGREELECHGCGAINTFGAPTPEPAPTQTPPTQLPSPTSMNEMMAQMMHMMTGQVDTGEAPDLMAQLRERVNNPDFRNPDRDPEDPGCWNCGGHTDRVSAGLYHCPACDVEICAQGHDRNMCEC